MRTVQNGTKLIDSMAAAREKSQKTLVMNMTASYLLACADGSYYCGWTNDLRKRVCAHNSGTASKYTRPRRPVELVYYETFATRQEAMRREYRIKRLTREQKEALIRNGSIDADGRTADSAESPE